MLITVNHAFAGGSGAETLVRQLQAATRGEEGNGGKRWRESKTSTPKTLPRES